VALAALALAVAAQVPAFASSVAHAQPTEEWIPAEGLSLTVETTCGELGGSTGEAVLTITSVDPERTWGYAVLGATLDIASPAADNSGSVEIPIFAGPGNYYAAAFHLPENGQTPITTAGFTIEPCQPGPPISVTTSCAAEGGSAVALTSLSELAPSFEYRQTLYDASGSVVGGPATFTADESGTRVLQSAPLADDAAYRSELHWLPPSVPDPGWPMGDFIPAESVPLSAANFTVGICATPPVPSSSPGPAPAAALPPTTPPARPTLAASGGPDATGWLAAVVASTALGLAALTIARLRRRAGQE
jgi:hypothetical protein